MAGERLEKLNLAVGARLNNHSTFGNDLTFEVNPSFRFSRDGVIFGSWSTGFNAPSLYRLYSPDANYLSNVRRGNLDLEPETSSSFELGLKKQFGSSTKLTLSLFQTDVDNLVEYVYLWDQSNDIADLGNDWLRDDYRGDTYMNLGRQTNKGIEVGLEAKLGQRFSFSGNLSITDGSLKYDPTNHEYARDFHLQLFNTGDFLTESIEKDGLVRRSNTANAYLKYQASSKVLVSVSMKHASSRNDIFYNANLGPYGALGQKEVGQFTLFGLSSNIKLTSNLMASIKIANLFNLEYQEIIGYRTRGRGMEINIRYSL